MFFAICSTGNERVVAWSLSFESSPCWRILAGVLELLAQSSDIAKSMLSVDLDERLHRPVGALDRASPGHARSMFVRSCVRSSGLNGV